MGALKVNFENVFQKPWGSVLLHSSVFRKGFGQMELEMERKQLVVL
jgi:hypothetical protein